MMVSPSVSQFDSTLNYFVERGFTPLYVSEGQHLITFGGPASLVESTFGVKLYISQVGNASYYFPSGSVTIPSQLSGIQVGGLSNYTTFAPQYIVLGKVNGTGIYSTSLPRSVSFKPGLYFSATYYPPSVFQQAYNETFLLNKGYSGQGQTIAVIDAYGDPTIYQDLQNFDSLFGLPPVQLNIIPIGPYQPEQGVGTGWDVETALDVEAAHWSAPGAKIDLIAINGNDLANGFFDAIDMIVSQRLANVTSMSWGSPENLFGASGYFASGIYNYPFADYYFALGSSEGISFFAASGDEGAYGGTPTVTGGVSFPASSPSVTAVGGTTLYVTSNSGPIYSVQPNISYSGESAWSISPQYAGSTTSSGGGYSTLFSASWYQSQVTGSQRRSVPDVSADANPYSGGVIVFEGQKLAIGGTSLATPMVAGMASLLDQYLGRKLGNLNPYLYSAHESQTGLASFHSVIFGNDGYYGAGEGYNLLTGLGSLNLGNFATFMKTYPRNLSIQVSTSGVTAMGYPQYRLGRQFNISATVTLPDGVPATSGAFTAYLYSSGGLVAAVPLTFNGNQWVGTYTPSITSPPNVWEVVVSGSSDGYEGMSGTSIDFGLSVNIVSPIPYPIGPPLDILTSFQVSAQVTDSNGTPVNTGSLTAYFYHDGNLEFSVPLAPSGGGTYSGTGLLGTAYPQGTYIMEVNGSAGGETGYAYTYVYFGQAILDAAILTPIDQGLPSAAPGQQITLLAAARTEAGLGAFDSNITAYFYSPSGLLMGQVNLQPAPNTVQFGILNLFGFEQANYTIPSNFMPGFYTVKFVSTYNDSGNFENGYFNTAIYIFQNSLLTYTTPLGSSLEGQSVQISASIRYMNGTPVETGVFLATVMPVALDYAANALGIDTGIPMQYNPSTGLWTANYSLPTSNSSGFYEGATLYTLAGPWNVIVSGESSVGVANSPSYSYFSLLPFTQLSPSIITPSNAASVPYTSFSNGVLGLYDMGGSGVTMEGLNVVISSGRYSSLTILDSNVTILDATLSGLNIQGSNVVLSGDTVEGSTVGVTARDSSVEVDNTVFENLTFAFDPVNSTIRTSSISTVEVGNLSVYPPPQITLLTPSIVYSDMKSIQLSIKGQYPILSGVQLNGEPVTVNENRSSDILLVTIPFSASANPDGLYTISLSLSDGLAYSTSITIANEYHSSQSQVLSILLGSAALVLAAIVLLLVVRLFRRPGQGLESHPSQAPQTGGTNDSSTTHF